MGRDSKTKRVAEQQQSEQNLHIAEWNDAYTHSQVTSGNPHSVLHSDLSDKGTNAHAVIDSHITTATAHIANTSNPHSVAHSQLSDKGTNTHAQIDTHLGLTNEHIDWTAAPAGTDLDMTTGANFKPYRIRQAAQPTPEAGELLIWSDSDDDKVYLVYNDANKGVVQVEMT